VTRIRLLALAVLAVVAAAGFLLLRGESEPDGPASPGGAGDAPAAAPVVPEFGDEAEPVTFAIAAPVDDHMTSEPCLVVPGGGFSSLRAYYDRVEGRSPPSIPVLLGDVTGVPGPAGALIGNLRYSDPCAEIRVAVVAAGLKDLSHGVDFLRRSMSQRGFAALCANATDADGAPLLRGWVLLEAEKRSVVLIGAAADTLEPELRKTESDAHVTPAIDAVAASLAAAHERTEGLGRRIHAVVLLFHGTPEEAAEIVREVPGITFAVAARGGDLPAAEPMRVGEVPVFSTGRDLRFGWSVTTDRGVAVAWHLDRLGLEMLSRGSPVEATLESEVDLVRMIYLPPGEQMDDQRLPDPRGEYVGPGRCVECHTKEASEHASSPHAGLSRGIGPNEFGRASCLRCHVTGAFAKTGWRGKGAAAELGGVSCEACHGPASKHLETPGPGWGRASLTQCRTCHTRDRSPDFDPEEAWRLHGHALVGSGR